MNVEVRHTTPEGIELIHVVLFENGPRGTSYFGAENLLKDFKTRDEVNMFMQLLSTLPIGMYGQFSWKRI